MVLSEVLRWVAFNLVNAEFLMSSTKMLQGRPTFESPIPLTPTAGFWLVGTVCINLVVFIYLLVTVSLLQLSLLVDEMTNFY